MNDFRMTNRQDLVESWWSIACNADILVFDLDGTLIDTDYANFLSYEAAISNILLASHPIIFDTKNRTTRKTIIKQFPNLSSEELNKIIEKKECLFPQYLTKTILNHNLVRILDRAGDKVNVLATNSRKNRADILLKHHGLIRKFKHIICGESIAKNNKYINLINLMPSKANVMAVFEDDSRDINQAISAGINPNLIINVRAQRCSSL